MSELTEQKWISLIIECMERYKSDHCTSWWLNKDTGLKTPKINYELGKLVKKGLLSKESSIYGIKYKLINNGKETNT